MKYFFIAAVFVFGVIGLTGWWKNRPATVSQEVVQEIPLGTKEQPIPIVQSPIEEAPEVDRVRGLFSLDSPESRIVETVSFTSRVPWIKDRPAWIADYATHYQTSRHFIARSLNKKVDYFTQKVHPGDRFNVLRRDKDIKFHLLVDVSKCRMWFYYLDGGEKVLLKTYKVGVGKIEGGRSLTPIGSFALGEKIAIYKPGVVGLFQGQKTEMIQVFGTRWIPFVGAQGIGVHGVPWTESQNGLQEDKSRIGKYDSDGCIRMTAEDIEELFAIVITKPTTVEIVKEVKL